MVSDPIIPHRVKALRHRPASNNYRREGEAKGFIYLTGSNPTGTLKLSLLHVADAIHYGLKDARVRFTAPKLIRGKADWTKGLCAEGHEVR
jgi:hypothetical protein